MAKINRSSKTGKFVTKKYASKHKATTETETIKKKKPRKGCEKKLNSEQKDKRSVASKAK